MPHTFSTFTRSDQLNWRAFAKLISAYSIFAALILMGSTWINFASIFLLYFLWQQFHYARQNLGVARWKSSRQSNGWIDQGYYLGVAAICVLSAFSKGRVEFFSYSLILPGGIFLERNWAFVLLGILVAIYLPRNSISRYHAVEHLLVFGFSFFGAETFAGGWLCLNLFHNFQYLAFMKSFEKSWRFLVLPAVLTVVLFILEQHGKIAIAFLVALNFTHYTWDALIWRRRQVSA